MAKATAARKKAEDKEHQALALSDAERVSRDVKISVIEGDFPYNKTSYINQCKFLLKQTGEGLILIGQMLIIIKEKEAPHGSFMSIVEDEIGIPYHTAHRYMNIALKATKYPSIQFGKFDKLSNLYALLEAPEEDLKELESKGVLAGNSIEDLQRMSVKEMRELIRKLRDEVNKVVKEEVKGLKTENAALVKELNRLKAFDPENKSGDWCLDQINVVDDILGEADRALRKFMFDPRIRETPEVMAKVQGVIERMRTRVEMLSENFDAFLGEEE